MHCALLIANARPPWSAGAGRTGGADIFAVDVSFGVAFAFAFGGAPGGGGKLLANPNRMLVSSCLTSILGATAEEACPVPITRILCADPPLGSGPATGAIRSSDLDMLAAPLIMLAFCISALRWSSRVSW